VVTFFTLHTLFHSAGTQQEFFWHALCVVMQVKLSTSSECKLAVSRYPMFSYNAAGGGGTAEVQQLPGNKLKITFDAQGAIPVR
jgi:hypothetical protein